MDLDKPLDEIIKSKRGSKKQPPTTQPHPMAAGAGKNNVSKQKPGPIRSRTIAKKATVLKAAPYVKAKSIITTRDLRSKSQARLLNPASIIISKAVGDAASSVSGRITSNATGLGLKTRHGPSTLTSPTRFNSMVADRISLPAGHGIAEPKKKSVNIRGAAGGKMTQFSIKGESGPATIVISNLDPGVIADDVKLSFMQVGEILTCTLKSTNRAAGATAEIQFARKADALIAINKFDNALADGRVLKVDLKLPGGAQSPSTASSTLRPTPPQASSSSGSTSKLYSDQIASGVGGHRTITAGRQSGSTTYSVRF
jgi:hypothetical protein